MIYYVAIFNVFIGFALLPGSGLLAAELQENSPQTDPPADIAERHEALPQGPLPAQRAYIDPQTGELTSRPGTGQRSAFSSLSQGEQNAASTSFEGLRQEVIPGKGVKVDLQGRFQSSIFATKDAAGNVSIGHQYPQERLKHSE